MPKRKVTFEDGNGEFDLEDDLPNKKVTLCFDGIVQIIGVRDPQSVLSK